jgi:hypothetical protein
MLMTDENDIRLVLLAHPEGIHVDHLGARDSKGIVCDARDVKVHQLHVDSPRPPIESVEGGPNR